MKAIAMIVKAEPIRTPPPTVEITLTLTLEEAGELRKTTYGGRYPQGLSATLYHALVNSIGPEPGSVAHACGQRNRLPDLRDS